MGAVNVCRGAFFISILLVQVSVLVKL